MSGIIMPEVILYKFLTNSLKLIREDIEMNSEKDTILRDIFGDQKMNSYDFFKQAKKIITNHGNLSVSFGYNPEVAKMISLHILLPSENSDGLGIGANEGYGYTTSEDYKESTRINYTQLFDTTYQILISSDNSSEVNIVYNLLKSLFLIFYDQLEVSGLQVAKIGGNDIVMRDDFGSTAMLFQKVLNLTFKYDLTVQTPKIFEIARRLQYSLLAVENFD